MSQSLAFQSREIRTLLENGEMWFAGKDVCSILGIRWNGQNTLSAIPDGWRRVWKYHTPSNGQQSLVFISEAGLYMLAFRSNKPEAIELTQWVAGEVLPAIRKTGRYEAPQQLALPAPAPSLPEPDLEAMHFLVVATVRALKDQTLDIYRVLDERLRKSGKFRHGHEFNSMAAYSHRSMEYLHRALDDLVDGIQANAKLVATVAGIR